MAIDEIEPGDFVLAYDLATGEWRSQEVLDQWSHLDDGHMATVTISDGTEVTATDHHLFWVDNDQAWVELDQVEPGDALLTPNGTVEVSDVVIAPVAETLVWELTVANDHNFTVHTGTTDLLVHNQPTPCGPGSWKPVNESMSARSREYQEQITGVSADYAYELGGVKFDGYSNGALQDAKGLGYEWGIDPETGLFRPSYHGGDDLVNQARRQLAAANGVPIQWSVASPATAAAIRAQFAAEGISGIQVVHVSPR